MIINIRGEGAVVENPTGGSFDAGSPKRPVRRISSESLFEGRQEIIITHRGEEYRLRLTKSGKLILTK